MFTTLERTQVIESKFPVMMRFVYLWMFFGLMISGSSAFYIGHSPELMMTLLGSKASLIGLIIAEFGLVIGLSYFMEKLNYVTAALMFIVFSAINGITLSTIFIVYELSSIFSVFVVTAGTFLAMTLIGLFTKKDLTKFGGILLMALIGLIIATVVNIFIGSTIFDTLICIAGVIIFCGLTAYDAQKIKELIFMNDDSETVHKLAIFGALSLYLDFINLFLYLLKLLGSKK